MQSTPLLNPTSWTETLYRFQQWGFSSVSLSTRLASFRLFELIKTTLSTVDQLTAGSWPTPDPSPPSISNPDMVRLLAERYDLLLREDWADAAAGVYPTSLLFNHPWADYLATYPQYWLDLPLSSYRAQKKELHHFGESIDTKPYPKYYLQNFHYQTDGYLSDQSAVLYDLQVELLFAGMAAPMRRRILQPLQEHFSTRNLKYPRILDVATGIGNVLELLRASFPQAHLYGVDLSPAYLRRANELLSRIPGELPQLVQANAETLPYADQLFDAVSCVFLFHELPKRARQATINEVSRVLKPGGLFVIADSIQIADSPEFLPAMEGFPRLFHEPYYRDYVRDDLSQRIQTAGLEMVTERTYYMSHYWIARKPNS